MRQATRTRTLHTMSTSKAVKEQLIQFGYETSEITKAMDVVKNLDINQIVDQIETQRTISNINQINKNAKNLRTPTVIFSTSE